LPISKKSLLILFTYSIIVIIRLDFLEKTVELRGCFRLISDFERFLDNIANLTQVVFLLVSNHNRLKCPLHGFFQPLVLFDFLLGIFAHVLEVLQADVAPYFDKGFVSNQREAGVFKLDRLSSFTTALSSDL